MTAAPAKQQFPLVQALRAGAALSVTTTHLLHEALAFSPNHVIARAYAALPWGAGVDVFFVISGFVIAYSSRGLFARPFAMRLFLARRLARIVPLYWLMTSLFLLSLWGMPGSIHGAEGGTAYILKSYAFIPAMRPDGLVQPALGLGWTLNYEMLFYAVFTPFLALPPLRAILGAVLVLALFVLAGAIIGFPGVILQFWSNPIVLEFCAGLLLSLLPGRLGLPPGLRAALALGALAALVLHPHEGPERFHAWGLPAACLVLAAITARPSAGLPRMERWLVRLGDASYALYLVHPFIMRGATLLWRHLHLGAMTYVPVCLVLSQAAALVLHRYVERPATAWVRARLAPGSAPVLAKPAASPLS